MLKITISNERQRRQYKHASGPLEFGRGPRREVERLVIEDRFVSRDQMTVEEISGGRLRVHNTGGTALLSDGAAIPTDETCELLMPIRVTIGYTMIEIAHDMPADAASAGLQTIARPVTSPSGRPAQANISRLGEAPTAEVLAEWFETLLTVQRSAAGSDEFYQETAKAVVELVGLDRGLVLLRRENDWEVVAIHTTSPKLGSEFSRRVLAAVDDQKRTFFESLEQASLSQSLVGVEAVVASPVLDEQERVIGVVYGSRDLRAQAERRGIQPLEAQVVQLLASAVSAGLARVEDEAEAARRRVQLEQFCSPELVRALECNPKLMDGHQREITVMFCDLRGFSRIAERLGPTQSYLLLGDVMDRFASRIIEHGGFVIDYYGDGLAAMWNDPAEQPDHAARACRAAHAMLGELVPLNETWSEKLGHPLRIGVGINTGMAQVGNAGSRRRLKYGPRGHTINLASRVEGATKHLGVQVLITGSTRAQLDKSFTARRLCQIKVVGIAGAVEISELLAPSADAQWAEKCATYERALTLYEEGQWTEARGLLETLQNDPQTRDDCPCRLLADRVTKLLQTPPEQFDPVFDLESK
jgi:adenylate cyclase